jgi:hypothetical protein
MTCFAMPRSITPVLCRFLLRLTQIADLESTDPWARWNHPRRDSTGASHLTVAAHSSQKFISA